MSLKNTYLALRGQFPLSKFCHNFFVTGNGWGLFSIHSHINKRTGKPKMMYITLQDAQKAAESLSKRLEGMWQLINVYSVMDIISDTIVDNTAFLIIFIVLFLWMLE